MDDQLCQGSVELAIGKRQLLGRGDAYVDPRMALAGCGNEWFRRIDRRDGCCSETPDQLGRQRARAAADVEHTVARRDSAEVRERRRQPNGVAAHEAVIGAGIDGEAHHGSTPAPAVVPSSTAY